MYKRQEVGSFAKDAKNMSAEDFADKLGVNTFLKEKIGDDYVLWKGSWKSSYDDDLYGTIIVPLIKDYESPYITNATITFDGSYNRDNRDKEVIVIVNVTNLKTLDSKEVNYLEFETIIDNQEIKYYLSRINIWKLFEYCS